MSQVYATPSQGIMYVTVYITPSQGMSQVYVTPSQGMSQYTWQRFQIVITCSEIKM